MEVFFDTEYVDMWNTDIKTMSAAVPVTEIFCLMMNLSVSQDSGIHDDDVTNWKLSPTGVMTDRRIEKIIKLEIYHGHYTLQGAKILAQFTTTTTTKVYKNYPATPPFSCTP